MFLSYDEAMGRFRATGARDPQVVASVAASARSTPNIVKWASIAMLIPGVATTLTIFGAIIGIPILIICGIMISKANGSIRAIRRAQHDYLNQVA